MKTRSIATGVLALSLFAGAASAMTVQEFLTTANAIPQNPTALLRSDTRRLMAAVPIADPARRDRERPLLEGEIPSAIRAIGDPPLVRPLVEVGEGHFVARHPIGDFA